MNFGSYRASIRSPGPFTPYMPGVDWYPESAATFEQARAAVRDRPATDEVEAGRPRIAIITPSKGFVMYVPAPAAERLTPEMLDIPRKILPPDPPLDIAVVSFTAVDALAQDKSKCIPFLGFLVAFAHLGHRVVVFEGHPTAFETGVRGANLLLVDSGMQPFLPSDWPYLAQQAMAEPKRILVHDRKHYGLREIVGAPPAAPMSFTPRVPETRPDADTAAAFEEARTLAASGTVAVVTPQREVIPLDTGAPPPGSEKLLDAMAPFQTPANVTVIACNEPERLAADALRSIPMLGLLAGLRARGHAVVVFEGRTAAYAEALRATDLLLVDGGIEPLLPEDWTKRAAAVMRVPRIVAALRDGVVVGVNVAK